MSIATDDQVSRYILQLAASMGFESVKIDFIYQPAINHGHSAQWICRIGTWSGTGASWTIAQAAMQAQAVAEVTARRDSLNTALIPPTV